MIDFRYHLVSIVAVFLALAVGLVLGATALKSLTAAGLEGAISSDRHTIDQLLASGRLKNDKLQADESFAQAAEPQLLAHLLAGQRVVLITAPGAAGNVTSGITTALADAGATLSGEIQLQAKFFDTAAATQQQLSQVAQQTAPPTLALSGLSPQLQAGKVLASAAITADGPGQPLPGVADGAAHSVLSGFATAGFLTQSGNPAARATLAVVVTPASPPSTTSANPVSQGLVSLAQQFAAAGQGTVVAGSVAGSGAGSAIDVMRSGGRGGHMSSVDDGDMVTGQIAVAQALYEELHGVSGNYGIAAGASGPGPSPAPTPSPTASATAAAGRHGAKGSKAANQVAASPSPSGAH